LSSIQLKEEKAMQLEVYETAFYSSGKPDANEAAPEAPKAKFPKLDTSIALWLILFVFGGGLLALYYAGIGYFPEVSWQDALTYMALMTIIGGSLLVAYSFLLFVPGAIWSEFLIFHEPFHQVLRMNVRVWEPCVWSVTKRILFPFALFMTFCHCLLFLQYEKGWPGFVAAGAAASLIAVLGLLGRDLWEGLKHNAERAGCQRSPADVVPDTSKLQGYRWFVGLSHAFLLGALIAKASDLAEPGMGFLWISALLPLGTFIGLLVYGWFKNRRRQRTSECQDPDRWSLLCRSILAFGSAALLSLAALWFFHRIYQGNAPEEAGIGGEVPKGLLVLCTLVVILANLAVSVLFRKHWRSALLTSFLAALVLLGAGQLLGAKPEAGLPAKIMGKFGFGGQSAALVLTERGGRLLSLQNISVTFEERPAQSKVDKAKSGQPETDEEKLESSKKAAEENPQEETILACVTNVKILSRLGSEYLLRYGDRIIALPKKEVVSWSAIPKHQELKIEDLCKQQDASSTQPDEHIIP
jgi:hypothetical protein